MVVPGGNFFPRLQYGTRLGISYKGFECNILFQGSGQVQGINAPAQKNFLPAAEWMKDHWTPAHPDAAFPRLWINYQNNSQNSTYWIVNTAYLRLKNIELAYTLPERWVGHAFKSARITLSGNNLVTFSRFRWYDPEAMDIQSSAAGLSNPILKSLTGGLTVQF
jgi:hypothetical protein